MAYDTHRQDYNAVMRAAEIEGKSKVTHMDRPDAACDMIERANRDFSDVGLYFGWHHDVAADKYLKASFKTGPMLDAAGWESAKEFYAWQVGEEDDIPKELLEAVMPELNELFELALEVGEDRSAIEVLKTLLLLRVVFLQEAVYLRALYPQFPAFKHPVFKLPQWKQYAADEERRVEERRSAHYYKLHDPAMAEMFKSQLDRMEEERQREREAMRIQHEKMLEVISAMQDRLDRACLGGMINNAQRTDELMGMVDEALASGALLAALDSTPEEPRDPKSPPFIPDPKSLEEAYRYWVNECRDFFNSCGKPAWKDINGSTAKAQKDRNQRTQPCFRYLDSLGVEGAQIAVQALEAFRDQRRLKTTTFIKIHIYNLVERKEQDTPIQVALKEHLQGAGVALPTLTIDQMRQLAWVENGKVRCAAATAAKIMSKAATANRDRSDTACDLIEDSGMDWSDVASYSGWHEGVEAVEA